MLDEAPYMSLQLATPVLESVQFERWFLWHLLATGASNLKVSVALDLCPAVQFP